MGKETPVDVTVVDDPDEWEEEESSMMNRIAILEGEVKMLKIEVNAIPTALEKEKMEIRKHIETIQALQTLLSELSATTVKSNQRVDYLGQQVEGVKKDTSSWLMVSVMIFGVFFIISLLIRAG